VFLKASLTHGSVYRDCHDHNWDAYSEWLSQFMTITSIRNDIFRCCVRDNVKSMFDEIPELLADVQEEDMRLYAVRGDEGVKPQVFRPVILFGGTTQMMRIYLLLSTRLAL